MLRCLLNMARSAARRSYVYAKAGPARPGLARSLHSSRTAINSASGEGVCGTFHPEKNTHEQPVTSERFEDWSPPASKVIPAPRKQTNPPYFRDTTLKMRDIERVLANPALAREILDKIHSGKLSPQDLQSMQLLVESAVDWATSTFSDDAYTFLIDAWHIVFFQCRTMGLLDAIRGMLRQSVDKLVHIMLNRGDFASYARLIEPLYANRPLTLKLWAMTVMEAARPTIYGHVYVCDQHSFCAFLDSLRVLRAQKHNMIAICITKALMFLKLQENVEAALKSLVRFFRHVEDAIFISDNQFFLTYKRPLTLLAESTSEASAKARIELIHALLLDRAPIREHSDFLSGLSRASAEVYPHIAIQTWEFKEKVLNLTLGVRKNPANDFRKKLDLTNAMLAHITLRAYAEAVSLYAAHEPFQDDEQITLLLRSSEKTKDWKLLQQQFEDMYGRGNLPYVIHYSVVMGALASIGATQEVEQLYSQLLRRQLKPTASIFRALIRSNINANNVDAAEKWYAVYLKQVTDGIISKNHLSALQLEVFQARLPLMNVSLAISELRALIEKHAVSDAPLLSTHTICVLVRFMLSFYSLKGFEAVWETAEQFHLADDMVYAESLAFLTKMGHFSRAHELAIHAQLHSPVPFQNSLILAAQLRNCRQWRKETTHRQSKRMLTEIIYTIINKVDHSQVSQHHLGLLLVEVIKHYTSMRKPLLARPYLDKANALNISMERHFVPFLKEYSTEGSYDGSSDVLDLYREMVARKMVISARTYYYLWRSLLMMDSANKATHGNAFNLLQSVLEMYGFSILNGISTAKVSVHDLSCNAIYLLQIVSEYAIESSAHNEGTMNLVLNFLKQIRIKLDRNIDYAFRVLILTEMSKVYRVCGNMQVAGLLVDNALKEMDNIIDQLPAHDPLPKLLQLDYRKTVDIKVLVLAQSSASAREYARILAHVLLQNVRLSGPQLHGLCMKALSASPLPADSLHLVLDACERFLVLGNWAEVKISRKVCSVYRMFLVYLGRTMSAEAIAERYNILNKLYNIPDVVQVLDEYKHIRSPRLELERALREYRVLCHKESWTSDRFFENLAEFFTPERTFDTKNFIRPNLAATIIREIESLYDGNLPSAFHLYDEYPETMEYLLFYLDERSRVVRFREDISKILGHDGTASVGGRPARRHLSIETLRSLWGQ